MKPYKLPLLRTSNALPVTCITCVKVRNRFFADSMLSSVLPDVRPRSRSRRSSSCPTRNQEENVETRKEITWCIRNMLWSKNMVHQKHAFGKKHAPPEACFSENMLFQKHVFPKSKNLLRVDVFSKKKHAGLRSEEESTSDIGGAGMFSASKFRNPEDLRTFSEQS